MQKKFKIEVDCANCAAKIETAVKALPGVENASVSFMTQKMLLVATMPALTKFCSRLCGPPKRLSPTSRLNCNTGAFLPNGGIFP